MDLCHSNIKFISPRNRLISSIYLYKTLNIPKMKNEKMQNQI
jgi:hypothetical protein